MIMNVSECEAIHTHSYFFKNISAVDATSSLSCICLILCFLSSLCRLNSGTCFISIS